MGVDVDGFSLYDGMGVGLGNRSEKVGVGDEGFVFVLWDDGEARLRGEDWHSS